MNRKKIENWVIFGLKLLPFLMLAIFAIYCHRHTIDNTTVPDSNSKVVSNVVIPPDSIYFDDLTIESFENGYYAFYNNMLLYMMHIDTEINLVSFIYYFYYSADIAFLNFDIILSCCFGDNYGVYELIFDGFQSVNSFEFNYYGGSQELYYDDHYVDEIVSNDFNQFVIMDFPYIACGFAFDYSSTNYTDDLSIDYFYLDSINYNNANNLFLSYDTTYNNFDNINPINASFIYFNEYLDYVMNFEIFNISGFYDWTVTNWFNNNSPLIYKPVFIILIYELLVDLLVLMYSFITFVIKFAQKWLNGIYNKDW